jgi:predicted MPP superfamily phosphohydrolase
MAFTRRGFLRAGIAGSIGLAAGAGVYGVAYERHRVSVTRAALRVARLPAGLAGLRIGVLTDLHHSALVSQQDIRGACDLLMSERPDLIALLGDYVTWGDRRYMFSCADALSGLSAPGGVFAILGNHDDDRVMPRALTAAGLEVLTDERAEVSVRGEPVTIAGIRYWTRKPQEIHRVVAGSRGSLILLAHDPRRLAEASALDVPLVLSGHTHGGQIVLPLIGPIAARKFPVAHGSTTRGSTTLFVSRGVGTVFVPIRLNCPPEVAVLTLGPAEPAG